MPELPEVENVRQSLAERITGRRVVSVTRGRHRNVVRGDDSPQALLQGLTLQSVARHGKQLALLGSDKHTTAAGPRCVCIHLGMSGSLRWHNTATPADHQHVIWQLDDQSTLVFRDPRRFGGIWTFPDTATLHQQRWSTLGEDALTITPARLHQRLSGTTRGLKAALLDQNLVAGLGNIYVDELLFKARLHPLMPANSLSQAAASRLVGMMRRLLDTAVRAGGSTLRDYVNANGDKGGYQQRHQVYGRSGQPCRRCNTPLEKGGVAGRTTVWCPACQLGCSVDDAAPDRSGKLHKKE